MNGLNSPSKAQSGWKKKKKKTTLRQNEFPLHLRHTQAQSVGTEEDIPWRWIPKNK